MAVVMFSSALLLLVGLMNVIGPGHVLAYNGVSCKQASTSWDVSGWAPRRKACCDHFFNSYNIFRTAVCCTSESDMTCLCQPKADLAGEECRNGPKPVRGCEKGWEEFEGQCYYFPDKEANGYTALSECGFFYAHLAHVKTTSVKTFLIGKLNGDAAFIGLEFQNSNWQWNDNTQLTDAQWASGQTGNGDSDTCVFTRNGEWQTTPCYNERHYVCQKATQENPQAQQDICYRPPIPQLRIFTSEDAQKQKYEKECESEGLVGFIDYVSASGSGRPTVTLICNGASVYVSNNHSREIWTTEKCHQDVIEAVNNGKTVKLLISAIQISFDACLFDELSNVDGIVKLAMSEALSSNLDREKKCKSRDATNADAACIAEGNEEIARLDLRKCKIHSHGKDSSPNIALRDLESFRKGDKIKFQMFPTTPCSSERFPNRHCFKGEEFAGCSTNDEGAPFYCMVNTQWVLRGFVSDTKTCDANQKDFQINLI